MQKAADQGALSAAEAPAAVEGTSGQIVRILGSKTFVFSDDAWVDTSFDPDKMKTIQVAFLSEDYFKLVQANPELASAFALGSHVIAISGGSAYEVVDEGASLPPLELPATPTPEMGVQDKPVPTIALLPATSPADQPQASNPLRCANGLAPLALAPLLGFVLLRRRRNR